MMTGILSGMAGSQSELTAGELRVAVVAERERAIQKPLPCLSANPQQPSRRESFQGRPRFRDALQILSDNARVDLAGRGLEFARAMLFDFEGFETLISLATTQSGDVRERVHWPICRSSYTRRIAWRQFLSGIGR